MTSSPSLSSSSSSSPQFLDYEKPNLDSIKQILTSISHHFSTLLSHPSLWLSLKSRCTSKLNINKTLKPLELSDHSVISNLYYAIETIETSIYDAEDKSDKLINSEKLLQAPALLDEHSVTAGIQNHYLICCSYFYLSLVRKLQGDEFQAALHFFQAVLVSPRLVRTELAAELCEDLFPVRDGRKEMESVTDFLDEANINDGIREAARRYKHWLMYYQVMLYGETPLWNCSSRNVSSLDDDSLRFWEATNYSSESLNSVENGHGGQIKKFNHPLDTIDTHKPCLEIQEVLLNSWNQAETNNEKSSRIKRIQEVLVESQSDSTTSEDTTEVNNEYPKCSTRIKGSDDLQPKACEQKLHSSSFVTLDQTCRMMVLPSGSQQIVHISDFSSCRFPNHIANFDLSISELRNSKTDIVEDSSARALSWPRSTEPASTHHKRGKQNSHRQTNEVHKHSGKDSNTDLIVILEKAISKLCFSEGLAKSEEEYAVQVTAIYEMLSKKRGAKYTILKDVILDQLLAAISSSKEERVIRASMSILTTIVSVNKSAIEDIKKKGLRLCDLATALKRNVHEAATLIYLINPPPTEIKTLELLPALMDVVCTSNSYRMGKPSSALLTPPAASLMIIEVLVTAFDSNTNNMHLDAIISPRILSRILDFARDNNLEECISMAKILIKCMQYDGQCRKHLSQSTPMAPFKRLLQSKEKRAVFAALQFFHELFFMPRSSAINLLQQMRKEGNNEIMHTLMQCVQHLQPEYQLLAANLLLQLDASEHSSDKSVFMEEAIQIILKFIASEENSSLQKLSTFLLANIGGTYTWTGEPYTVAFLVKKAGLTSLYHRNLIRNFDWSDQCLQDAGIDSSCSKIAKGIISIGKPVFEVLAQGLRSKTKRVSRDSLTAIAWIGCEMAKHPSGLRNSACDILVSGIEQFLHPGIDLDERLLACLCIYNYTSGRGLQKLIHFSEGVRESLRRFSGVTWMAEELHRVADFYVPNRSRISCVHTQILEAKPNSTSGAVTALIYYRGLIFGGYSDGSIKVWDIKQQSATLLWDIKEHKKTVTCFSLYEPGESLLSGSADKTVKVWQMVHTKLECVEVVQMKEAVQKIETYGQTTFIITQGHGLKMFDSSRVIKDVCKSKKVKCIIPVQGKLYVGCMDSSIQEFSTVNNREREIKPPLKSWRLQNKPINSIVLHKDWLYSATSIVEGSKVKEWRTQYKPQISMVAEKSRNIVSMGVVEDFIYLNCGSSTGTLQIWLRETQQNVGRISAGSKITSLLTANDIVLCGNEKGLIKGWIPL
ncbi:Transducin/WD40 repeat-like superfamily protein [Euphorbia peplus]|nr:Transducin/WD40 repeat-like superfamily protein [Euphorbia peplus]